jgi:hypothetical protein
MTGALAFGHHKSILTQESQSEQHRTSDPTKINTTDESVECGQEEGSTLMLLQWVIYSLKLVSPNHYHIR